MMDCLDENRVVEFIQGLLSPEAALAVEKHLDDCPSCRRLMAEVARFSFASSRRAPPAEELAMTATLSSPGPAPLDLQQALRGDMPSTPEPLPEQVLAGRFRIVRQLGRGSFGAVFEAEDLQLKERVALKLLRPEVRDNPSLLGHLHHEIVVGRRVSHPNVCRIHDLCTWGDTPFITMALVGGLGLDRFMELSPPTTEQAVEILIQICGALEAAHAQGVVHRDLKPSNIMIDAAGSELRVTVMDFGLARDLRAGLSQSGALVGSPAYWSPEQARGGRANECSDIYTLGLIACDLFGERRPGFGRENEIRVPMPYRSIVERCLRILPEDRYPSARAVREALVRARAWPWRRWALIAVIAAAVLGGGALLLSSGLWSRPTTRPPGSVADEAAQHGPSTPNRAGGPVSTPLHEPDAAVRPSGLQQVAAQEPAPIKRAVRSVGRGEHRRAQVPPLVGPVEARHPRPDAGPSPLQRALDSLKQRLEQAEAGRMRSGILADDAPGLRGQLQTVKQALSHKDEPSARAALDRLEALLRSIRVDQAFVERKLQRINALKGSKKLDAETATKVSTNFQKVHDRFFSKDYEGANAHLNSIWRVLSREE